MLPVQFLCSHRDLVLENLALRQQLAVLRRRHPQPRFAASDRFFWVILRQLWGGVEAGIGPRQAGHCCSLAPGGVQVVLDRDFSASKSSGEKMR